MHPHNHKNVQFTKQTNIPLECKIVLLIKSMHLTSAGLILGRLSHHVNVDYSVMRADGSQNITTVRSSVTNQFTPSTLNII